MSRFRLIKGITIDTRTIMPPNMYSDILGMLRTAKDSAEALIMLQRAVEWAAHNRLHFCSRLWKLETEIPEFRHAEDEWTCFYFELLGVMHGITLDFRKGFNVYHEIFVISLGPDDVEFVEQWNYQTGEKCRVWSTSNIERAMHYLGRSDAERAMEAAKMCGYESARIMSFKRME